MVKKKEDSIPVTEEAVEALVSLIPPAREEVGDEISPAEGKSDEAEEPERLYTEGTWKGLPQWRCKLCAWDTLKGEEEMIRHIQEVHRSKPKTERVELPLVDRFGNPIVKEVEVKDG